ncbi:hypothetical protein VHEMI05567 [[Torrubiella] hemipterigena]|uniref:Uncharacterized protein n=1 Tax=[Torrubiella] hemipterigena TaxID=1531966 RepID=A0A0A1TJ41_9HYPO|nr:hypothetical protein VHEMI05567 [[Torrubiella] hemipterigena]
MVLMMPFLALNSLQEFHHNFGYAEVKIGLLEDSCCSKHTQDSHEIDADGDQTSTDAESDNEAEHDYIDDYIDADDDEEDDEDDDSSDCSYDSHEPRREREEADYHSYDGCFMHPRYPVLGKNVEIIIMHNMELFQDSSYVMFRDMHKLENLQIRYADGDDHDMQWDIAGCITGIMCSVGANLEDLVLEVAEAYEFVSRIRLSLHDFKVLKRLWLTTVFFVNGAAATADYRDEDAEEDDKFANGPIEPLVYVLPPSLEHFILTVSSDHGKHLPLLFEGFGEQRQEHLPHLRKVTLHIQPTDYWGVPYGGDEDEIIRFAKEYGFDLE